MSLNLYGLNRKNPVKIFLVTIKVILNNLISNAFKSIIVIQSTDKKMNPSYSAINCRQHSLLILLS
jgi:hypothetical protein